MQPLFGKVTIIGVGLIGGSLGMALCSRCLAGKVVGVDIDYNNLKLAEETEAIHEGELDIEAAVTDADLIVVAVPVGVTLDIIGRIAPVIKKGCIVTDVGSTKADIVAEADRLMPAGAYFVGGHPMTGSEMAGVRGADRYLFENAVYILTPSAKTDRNAVEKVKKLVCALGANAIEMDPRAHDLMVAAVSHLPHLVAAALVNTVGEVQKDHEKTLMLAAGGFRDTTRIASGQPLMWKDICLSNRESILAVLDKFGAVLDQTRRMVEECDEEGLEEGFARARELRGKIPSKLRGYLPPAHEIVVTVPDRPGVIANLAGHLGNAGINIKDIEILRVREGEGGTIRLAFISEEEQLKAVEILRKEGISVKKR